MRFKQEREEIVEYGKKMITEGLTTGTGGNISCFLPDEQLMLISPTGIPYNETSPEDIVIMNLAGEVVEGHRKPSSEYDMHRIFYQRTKGVNSVVHTHSDYATAISCVQQSIPPLHYIIGSVGKEVRCSAYKTFGTYELAEEAFKTMENNHGILLGNHGVLTIGSIISEAFSVAKDIEFLAKLQIRAKSLGEPVLISPENLEKVIAKFDTYGQQ